MNSREIVLRRLREQRLTGDPFQSPAEVVGWLGGMQAQEYAEAKWSIAERLGGTTEAEIDESFDRGEILRTHVLRPTWHFVTPADIRWMLKLTAPRIRAQMKYYTRRSDLDEAVLGRSAEILRETLADGEPRLRRELADALADGGVDPGDGQRLGLIAMHCEIEAVICSGPRRGRQHTYSLLDQRAPDAATVTDEEALAELARRYFRSHGPATRKDLCMWSSLTVADARHALELLGNELAATRDDHGTEWFAAADATTTSPPKGGCLLIPMYDETVMGYKDLRVSYSAQPPQSGVMNRPIVIDGLTVGSWKRTPRGKSATVEATLFTELAKGDSDALNSAVGRFSEFLGLPVELEIALAA